MISGILLGICVGLIMGLTGAGGGILAVPALMFAMGLTLLAAKPVALIAVGAAALVGTFHGLRQGLVRYRAALTMALAGLVTAPLGVWSAALLHPTVVSVIFIVVMIISGVRMLLSSRELSAENQQLGRVLCPISDTSGRFIWTRVSTLIILMIGAAAGFFTGLLGVGGGFIIVPALLALSNISLNSAVATSLMVITLNALITLTLTLDAGIALSIPLWAFVICTLAGLSLGRLLVNHIPESFIRYGFSALSFTVAAAMLVTII